MFDGSGDNVYFASKDPKDTAGIVLEKAQSFFNLLRANAYLEKLQNMWRFYHGAYENDLGYGHKVNFTGEQGELVQFPVNHFRNLAQHIYVMITANRPIMEARAVNTDYKSLSQTYVANSILDYYMREKRLEDVLKKACELSIVLGAGFVKMSWNATAGEIYEADPDTGEPIYEGEIEFTTLTPLDVVVDGTKENWDNDWILTRSFQNRFNLMAKYPELAEKIAGILPKNQSAVYRLAVWSNDDTDDIPVYEFFHRRTEAMPDGRYILFLDPEVILMDTKMPYRTIPIFRIAPSDILGTPYGYTPMFDVFPIQELINSTYSTIASNQTAFGVQNVYVPRGADIAVNQLEGAMNIIEGNPGLKPEALNLTQTPAEVFKFLDTLIQAAETISGVNSVARGNPEASLKSGTALALVQSMALQFVSGLQQSYVKLIEDVGTGVIQVLKDFAITPKTVALVGKNNRPFLDSFTGEDISSINRVIVDVGNPLSRTIAGRVQMAEQMIQMHLITRPEDYLQVISTGRLDSMYEGEMNELLLIKSENEMMLSGQAPIVSPMDKHSLHIQEHKAIIADPNLRKDPNLVKVALDHVEAHLNSLRTTDPSLLSMIGEQALPPFPVPLEGQLQQPPPPMPQPGSPQGQNGPPQPNGRPPQANGNKPMGPMLQNQNLTPPIPGQVISNGEKPNALPNIPKPPGVFKNLPVLPNQMAPPTRK